MRRRFYVPVGIVAAALLFACGWFARPNRAPRAARSRHPDAARADPPPRLAELDRERADPEALAAIPYLGSVSGSARSAAGVLSREAAAFEGLNLVCSWDSPRARLFDMQGKLVHEWKQGTRGWNDVALLPDGSLLAAVNEQGLLKLDRNSRPLWWFAERVHHEFQVASDGSVRVLVRKAALRPEIHARYAAIADEVVTLDANGRELGRVSILEAIERSSHAGLLPSAAHRDFGPSRTELDVLHANSVEAFDGRLAGKSPLFAKGNLLVSMRTIDSVAIVKPDSLDVLWLWGPSILRGQHHATLLDNGHVLVFNNGLEASGAIEVDPLTWQVEWQYSPGKEFFSRSRGAAQRLPNGNTLLSASDKGYAREVTPQGRVVWEYANPENDEKGQRLTFRKVTRYRREELRFLGR